MSAAAAELIKYDAMCHAIAECHRVDEVKDLRDKAMAFECYARQAQNTEAERKAAEIRIRAKRRCGELLKEMAVAGERQKPGDNLRGAKTKDLVNGSETEPLKPKLSDLKITKKQSSLWQRLAEVPEKDFERGVRASRPSSEGIVNAHQLEKNPPPKHINPDALWLWGRLKDLERWESLAKIAHADALDAETDFLIETGQLAEEQPVEITK